VVALAEEELEMLAVDGGKELPSPAHGKNAAYVLFTSGSTGEPKVRPRY
jgi:acyl-coenzyme A synthetase/AMP-(fatty) acid ligase